MRFIFSFFSLSLLLNSSHIDAFAPVTLITKNSDAQKDVALNHALFAKKKGKGNNKSKVNAGRSTSKGFGQPGTKEVVTDLATKTINDASQTILGKTVRDAQMNSNTQDEFWEIIPALIHSRFPHVTDAELKRIAGVIAYANDPMNNPVEEALINDPYRPHEDIHAYMPNLGPTKPFYEASELELCSLLQENIDVIEQEYHALLENDAQTDSNRFQSVTSMNYDAGWKTMVLFYNGHRIPDFPYHLCPVTTKILESVPLAGRIAGFNRQSPNSGIPLHSDGNNMWLTCQMGITVPTNPENAAWIRVGPETRHWKKGECLLYDTTYEHETFNSSLDQERVVLHVDFFNTLAMTKTEIDIMTYIYDMKEKFLKAEGAAKVGAQVL